jgi:CubicO group peptidase (beta-lactamase class C family)
MTMQAPDCQDLRPAASPHSLGLDETQILALLDDARGVDLHNLLLYRRGQVALDASWWPYAGRRRVMHSVAKSFTSAAIGLALAEGRLMLDDTVVSFFPEHLPATVDDKLAAMTVEDLLTMRAGHDAEISGSVWRRIQTSWIAEFFKLPVVHRPGTTYVYSSAASYMLSAIITKVTGQTLYDYLKPRLFAPLGITGESWDIGSDGINPGGNGLTVTPMDLLKFASLYAQDGLWQGRRILPASWIAQSVRPRSRYAAGGHQYGYGYHWHTSEGGAYFAAGLFGQIAAVFPALDLVAVVTSAIPGAGACTGKIMPLLNKHLPAIARGGVRDPALDRRLESIAEPLPLRSLAGPLPELVGTRRYRIAENPLGISEIAVTLCHDACLLALTDAGGRHDIAMGIGSWLEGMTDIPGQDLHRGYALRSADVVAGARWLDGDTLEMHWTFAGTAFRDTVVCSFADGAIRYARSVNVNSGAVAHPVLVGELV